MYKFKVVDLFAGAGGLSLGFENTVRFEVKAAVEKNQYAQETYRNNFRGVDYYNDINDINFIDFRGKYGSIDVVIGGPPCQGFSNANRQHNQAINLNNKLVKEFIRAILQLQPKAFVMENVSMLKSNVHRFYIEQKDVGVIEKYHIKTDDSKIFLLNKEYIFDEAQEIVEDVEKIADNQWTQELFKIVNILYKNVDNEEKLKNALQRHSTLLDKCMAEYKIAKCATIAEADTALFEFLKMRKGDAEQKKLKELLERPVAYQKMLQHALEIHDNRINASFTSLRKDGSKGDLKARVKSCAVYDYLTSVLGSEENGYTIDKGILAAVDFGIPQKRRRFVIIGVKKKYSNEVKIPVAPKNIDKTSVYDAIADLQDVPVYYSVNEDQEHGSVISKEARNSVVKLSNLRNTNGLVYNHIVPKTGKDALERFKYLKEGQNFHDLPKELKTNTYSNAGRTQNTVYQRLKYKEPSGTVINVRKSMWIHPTKDRAISIREAARLQTFPDSFRFYGPKDAEYQQVGNAVPPLLAQVIAEKILYYLEGKGK